MKHFLNPERIPIPGDWNSLYKKVRPFYPCRKGNSFDSFYEDPLVIEKNCPAAPVCFKDLAGKSYLADAYPAQQVDQYDITFVENYTIKESYRRYGYHQGSYGSFKPLLTDVIRLGQDIIRESDVCYVTTEPCNFDGQHAPLSYCFNEYIARCYGITHYFPMKDGKMRKKTFSEMFSQVLDRHNL